ncbi:hypothetical protein HY622_02340 [Candidatus Uhrbacteria bacterium]|nr:hypothetical protein [Candidatus Uhrbacteria bacterium]
MRTNRDGITPRDTMHAKTSLASRLLYGEQNEAVLRDPEYQEAIPRLRELYTAAWRWHGTGRYHHHGDAVIDVLKEIIEAGGLTPHEDIYDYTREGAVHSVSTSPSRTYASLYAQCHFEKGKSIRKPFQTKAAWFYYLASAALEAAKHDRRLFSRKFREQINLDKKGGAHFHKKYTKAQASGKDLLQGGVSDISGNYPMLIGIKAGTFQEIRIAKVLQKHESRSGSPILMHALTHIEVPLQNVAEARSMVASVGLSDLLVLPIEWGEEFCKSLPVSFLKDGKPL